MIAWLAIVLQVLTLLLQVLILRRWRRGTFQPFMYYPSAFRDHPRYAVHPDLSGTVHTHEREISAGCGR